MNVGTPEAVYGLLGVTYEDQVGAATDEGPPQHGPLHGVRVLELVDQHHLVALAQALARQGAPPGMLQGAGQAVQELVVGEQVLLLEAAGHLLAGTTRQPPEQPAPVIARVGDQRGVGIPGRFERRPASLGQGEGRVGFGVAQAPPQVQVVDDILQQLGRVLEQHAPGWRVARGAEPVQDHLAEPVGGGDGGRVELGQSVAYPVPAGLDLGGRPSGQQGHDGIAVQRASPGERFVSVDQP